MTPPAERPDPRTRPDDPAGTRPKVDPESLLALPRSDDPLEGDAVEEPVGEHRWLGASTTASQPGALALDTVDGDGDELGPPVSRGTRHTPRFQFLFGALIALALSAVAAAAIFALAGRGSGDDGADTWAAWHPAGKDKVSAIAAHVGPEYRLPSGRQLLFVTGGKLEIAGLDMEIVIQQTDLQLLQGKGVLYRMCGLGPQCSIDEGKPSIERGLLVRREALELALYTFRYQKDTDNVVVFMPPVKGKQPTSALLFRRNGLGQPLRQPLRATLSRRTPSVMGVAAAPDTPVVSRLTAPTQFSFKLTQANRDNLVYLVLSPPKG